jgi:flagellar hook-length control protein FliK
MTSAAVEKDMKNKFVSMVRDVVQHHEVRITAGADKQSLSTGARIIDPQKLIESLAKETASSIKNGVTELNVQLEPEHLGKMTLRFSAEEGQVAVRIEVNNSEVKQVVDAQMPRLREELQQRGISMDRVEVFVAGDSLPKHKREQSGLQSQSGTMTLNHDDTDGGEEDPAQPRNLGYNTIEYLM